MAPAFVLSCASALQTLSGTWGYRVSGIRPGQGRRGVPVAEAAKLLGLNYEAVRKRIKRGTLPAYKQDDRWYVLLDVQRDTVPDNRADVVPDGVPGHVPDNSVTPAIVEQVIARTGRQYTADLHVMLTELREVYAGQIAAKDETISELRRTHEEVLAADALAIAELRRRAEAAEAARDRLTAAQAAPAGPGAPEAPTPDDPSGVPSAGFWARVRRVFGGE